MPKITLNKVRMAFPAIWEPESINGGAPKYGARLIIVPGSENAKKLDAAIAEAAKLKFKAKADAVMKSIGSDKMKMCYLKSDYANDEGDVYDGFEGMYHLSAKADAQPTIIDRDRSRLTQQDGRPYSGCYINAIVEIYGQDNTHGKGMRCGLKGIQFHSDGDAFQGGAPASADDFEDLTDGAHADEEDEDEFA